MLFIISQKVESAKMCQKHRQFKIRAKMHVLKCEGHVLWFA